MQTVTTAFVQRTKVDPRPIADSSESRSNAYQHAKAKYACTNTYVYMHKALNISTYTNSIYAAPLRRLHRSPMTLTTPIDSTCTGILL